MMGGDIRFAGYAAIFDHMDRGGDIIRAGAFASAQTNGIPLLWQHDRQQIIGSVEMCSEDERGLRVIGHVSERTACGRAAAAALRDRALGGLSFGYYVQQARGQSPRELLSLDVVEVSLVTHPMQPLARILAIEEVAIAAE